MALTYTQSTLEKLEAIFKTLGYSVRIEKGNFKTAACLLQSSKVIVVNKYSSLESRINALAGLLKQSNLEEKLLDDKQKAFVNHLKQTRLQL